VHSVRPRQWIRALSRVASARRDTFRQITCRIQTKSKSVSNLRFLRRKDGFDCLRMQTTAPGPRPLVSARLMRLLFAARRLRCWRNAMVIKRLIRLAAIMVGLITVQTATAQAPAAATALCKDGSYYSGEKKQGACRGHQGIKEWYGTPTKSGEVVAGSREKSAPASVPSRLLLQLGPLLQ
jgi:hypothetical protein